MNKIIGKSLSLMESIWNVFEFVS